MLCGGACSEPCLYSSVAYSCHKMELGTDPGIVTNMHLRRSCLAVPGSSQKMLRVLAIEQFGSGLFGTMHPADLGAEVIKVEDPR